MRSLKYPVEHFDVIFVHLLHDRLDPETSKAWELKRESERPKIQDMLKFLDTQAKAISGKKRKKELAIIMVIITTTSAG